MDALETYRKVGHGIPGAAESQFFGKPCFKADGKAFAAFFEGAMVFKLTGHEHREALALDGSLLFDPSKNGRPMKEWVQVPAAYSDRWPALAQAAFDYVSQRN